MRVSAPRSAATASSLRHHSIIVLALLGACVTAANPLLAFERHYMCGEPVGSTYTALDGTVFEGDPGYTAGNGAGRIGGWELPQGQTWKPVGGTPDQMIYLQQRNDWTEYRFDVPSGDYLVRLHFADILGFSPGSRVLDIVIEGVTVIDDLDVRELVNDEHYAMSRAFAVSVTDGQLNITGSSSAGFLFLNALEVETWAPHSTPPALVAGLTAYPSYERINIDWDDGAENDLAGYHLERSSVSGGPYTRLTNEPIPVSRYFDDDVSTSLPYYYRAVAVDVFGNESAPTAEVPSLVKDNAASPLPLFEITIDPALLDYLQDHPLEDNYRTASVTYQGQTWGNVGVRFRGRIARELPKKSWKIKFDEFVPTQMFGDEEEINLNAHHGERTQLRESASYEVHHLTGVPASEASHARLMVNGEYMGVFTRAEQVDQRWLDLRGYPGGGNLYKSQVDGCLQLMPDSLAYTEAYGKKTNRTEGYDDLIQFIELINLTAPDSLYHKLSPIFDIEGFFNFYATQIALANDSFYCHNFYLYHDLDADYWYYLPWDLDTTFGHLSVYDEGVFTELNLLTGLGFNGLISGLQQIPHFRNRYLERTMEILLHEATVDVMDPFIDMIHAAAVEDQRIDWFKWGWEDNSHVDAGNTTIKTFLPGRRDYTLFAAPFHMLDQELFINEICTNNDAVLADEMGDFDDFFEILNNDTQPVDMSGMFLTDDITMPMKWAVPDTMIQPGERMIFWADNEEAEGPTHTNFALEDRGEFLGLFAPIAEDNEPIDTKSWGQQLKDVSYGRFPDASFRWVLMGTPTPGAPNTDGGNLPPVFIATEHTPEEVNIGAPVTVASEVTDFDDTVASVSLFYDVGSGFVMEPMLDDGMSGDGAAGDGVWAATIPGQQAMTVTYYALATDSMGRSSTHPNDAPIELFSYVVGYIAPSLVLNEFMADNVSTIPDPDGIDEFDDWVEITNTGGAPVPLLGLALSDNFTNRSKYIFPDTTLGSGEHLLVWCDNDPFQGPYHADFRLSAGGERIGLFGPQETGFAPIDTLHFAAQFPDTSFGRFPDGGPTWVFYDEPTPGAPNPDDIGVEDGGPAAAPRVVTLGAARPNPLYRRGRGVTTIPFGLPSRGAVSLKLYDVKGRLVRELVDATYDPGSYEIAWDGRDQAARTVASGIYFLRLQALSARRTQKIVVLR